METSVRGDLRQKDRSKNEREGLQDGSNTCYDLEMMALIKW